METGGKQHVIHYRPYNENTTDCFLHTHRDRTKAPQTVYCDSHICATCLFVPPLSMLLWPWPTLLSLRGDRLFPRVLVLKTQGLETFPQAAFPSRDRFVHGHACGLVLYCRQTEDRCVWSHFHHHPPPSPWSSIPFLPPSSSPNLGLIVSVIKHSCTDPSLNPLSSADYMGVRGLSSQSPVTQPCSLHGDALLFPWHT